MCSWAVKQVCFHQVGFSGVNTLHATLYIFMKSSPNQFGGHIRTMRAYV